MSTISYDYYTDEYNDMIRERQYRQYRARQIVEEEARAAQRASVFSKAVDIDVTLETVMPERFSIAEFFQTA